MSIKIENSNGASANRSVPVPVKDPTWTFTGELGPEEFTKLKQVVYHDLRVHGLEAFVEKDIEELYPDAEDYDLTDRNYRRMFKQAKKEVVRESIYAWNLVRGRFKEGSRGESIVAPTDPIGSLHIMWKTVLDHYSECNSKRGVWELAQKLFNKELTKSKDILAHFGQLKTTINDIQNLVKNPNPNDSVGLTTPTTRRLEFATSHSTSGDSATPNPGRPTRFSNAKPETIELPRWFPTYLTLLILAQNPKHTDTIEKFTHSYLIQNHSQRLDEITMDACFEQLKIFQKIQNSKNKKKEEKKEEKPQIQVNNANFHAKEPFFCSFHGPNYSHSTKYCQEIHQSSRNGESHYQRRAISTNGALPTGRTSGFKRSPSPYRPQRKEFNRSGRFNRERSRSSERGHGHSEPRRLRFDQSPSPNKLQNFHTEVDDNSWGSNYAQQQAINATYSSELPPTFANTPPNYAYEHGGSDTEIDDTPSECYHIDLKCTAIEKEEVDNEETDLIIGDNGCNAIIFNTKMLHLVYDIQPAEGTIFGATGSKNGAIKYKGFVDFMGVKCRCFVANITKSCIGLNYTAVHYGFKYKIEGKILSIHSSRSGKSVDLIMNNQLLSEMPESLFGEIEIETNLTTLDSNDLYTLIHCRLGHPHEHKIRFMASQEMYQERGLSLADSKIKPGSQYCDICAQAKGHKIVSHREVDKDAAELGLVWHADLPAKSEVPGIGTGNYSRILFTERKSRYRVYMSLKDNTEEEILRAMIKFYNLYQLPFIERYKMRSPVVMAHLYADNGEMKYPKVREFLKSKLTFLHYTAPGHSSSNGLAEVGIKAVRTISRALLATYTLPEEFWECAEKHAVFLLNRLPFMYRGRYAVDPLTVYSGKTADYSTLRIFGSKVHVFTHTRKDSRPRSIQGIFVGYAPDSITPTIYLPTEDEFVENANVIFRELDPEPLATQVIPKESEPIHFPKSEKTLN